MKLRTRSTRVAILGALAVALPLAHAQAGQQGSRFTWWNDLPELIRQGNEAYFSEQYEQAEDAYTGAQLLAPQEAAAAFNRGLVLGRQGNLGAALDAFARANRLAGDDAQLRGRANYNMGLMHAQRALDALLEEEDMDRSLQEALEAIDRFDDALRYNPDDDAAIENRRQIQHFLEMFATQPPPQPEQPEPDDSDSDEGGEAQPEPQPEPGTGEEDGDQPSPTDPGDMDGDQQEGTGQPEPQEGESESGEGESQPDGSDSQQEQDAQPEAGEQELERPREMTPEEAEQYLNLLGERNDLVLRRGRGMSRPDPEKFW